MVYHRLSSIVILVALFLFYGLDAVATSWRIHNNANRHAHFTSINAAMSSSEVQDGDTLYLDPGCNITSTQTVSKRVTIIGTGYSLEGSVHDVASINASLILTANGIKVEGVAVTSTSDKTWSIRGEDVTIERCHVHFISVEGKYATIRQCRGFHFYGKGNSNIASAYCTIENCLLGTDTSVDIYDFYRATIRNNYIWTQNNNSSFAGLLNNLGYCTIVNNIIVGARQPNVMFAPANLNECIITNNVMTCEEGTYPDYPQNRCLGSNTSSAVFSVGLVDRTLSDKEFSGIQDIVEAKGYATDGGDCGPFGGAHPYVFSGHPFGMPYYVSGSSDTRATDGKVRFSHQLNIQTK